MSQQIIRRAGFVILTAVFAAGPMSASGMQAQGQAPVLTTPPAPQGPSISLSMQQAVDMALESNIGIKGDRLAPQIAAQNVASARAAYTPTAFSTLSRRTTESVPQTFFESGQGIISNKNNSLSAGIGQASPWFGGSYQVSWTAARNVNSSPTNPFNPSLGSTFSASFNQPLWRGLKIDGLRLALKNSVRQEQIADVQLADSMARTELATRSLYLNLIAAIEGRKVSQQNLDLSRETLRNNRARVQVGLMAPADVVDTEAAVADREEALIISEGLIERVMDQLRQQIFEPSRPDYWTVRIIPTDTVDVEARQIDVEAAVRKALEQRTDLLTARKNLEITNASIDLLHNQTMPSVNLGITYSSSGTAGTQYQFVPGTTDVASQTSRGFRSAIADSFQNQQPAWSYIVQVGYPIGKSDTEASLARTRLQKRQGDLQLQELELQTATQVKDAARSVETSYRRVQAARASLASQEKRLEQEQKKFDVGLSTTFSLTIVQQGLAFARINELQARIAYTQALINFDSIQRIR